MAMNGNMQGKTNLSPKKASDETNKPVLISVQDQTAQVLCVYYVKLC